MAGLHRRSLPVVVGALVLPAVSSRPAVANPAEGAPGAARLESRLLAPCCWNQTLDVHESELASALRAEIQARLTAGESEASIESELVARYGERVRALPPGKDPRLALGVGGALVTLAAGWLVARKVRRWARPQLGAPVPPAPAKPAEPDELDARIDSELARMD